MELLNHNFLIRQQLKMINSMRKKIASNLIYSVIILAVSSCGEPEDKSAAIKDSLNSRSRERRGTSVLSDSTKAPLVQATLVDQISSGELSINSDGLLSAYNEGGIVSMREKINQIGPGLNRKKAIESLLSELSLASSGLAAHQFEEIIGFIDQLPYQEDKSGLSGPELNTLVKAQSVETVLQCAMHIESGNLKSAIVSALAVSLGESNSAGIRRVVDSLPEESKAIFVSTWADRLKIAGPSEFDSILTNEGLRSDTEKMAIDSYVNSLSHQTGPSMIASATSVSSRDFATSLYTAGFERWLTEDSMAASAELAKRATDMKPDVYDKIVKSLVMQLQTQGDFGAAIEWNSTVHDPTLRKAQALFLQQQSERK